MIERTNAKGVCTQAVTTSFGGRKRIGTSAGNETKDAAVAAGSRPVTLKKNPAVTGAQKAQLEVEAHPRCVWPASLHGAL